MRFLLPVMFALGACAANGDNAQLQAQFAAAHNCPAARVEVVSTGPNVMTARGCGTEQVYVCMDSPGADRDAPHTAEGTEAEFRYRDPECRVWTQR